MDIFQLIIFDLGQSRRGHVPISTIFFVATYYLGVVRPFPFPSVLIGSHNKDMYQVLLGLIK